MNWLKVNIDINMAKSDIKCELFAKLDEARFEPKSVEKVFEWALKLMGIRSLRSKYKEYLRQSCNLNYGMLGDYLRSSGKVKPRTVGVPKEVEIKIKKVYPDAKLPTKVHPTDAGWDLYVYSGTLDKENGLIIYELGISMEIPDGYVGLIFPRSSIFKTQLVLSNCVGVIDSGYRGQVKAMFRFNWWKFIVKSDKYGLVLTKEFPWIRLVKFDGEPDPGAMMWLTANKDAVYHKGERCCQMVIMPYPKIKMTEVTELSDSDRQDKGFGGSGR